MKTLLFILLVFLCTFLVQAQEKPDTLQSIPFDKFNPEQWDYPYDSFPQLKLPDQEAHSLANRLFKNPGDINGADNSVNGVSDYFNMPIVGPGSAFSSNMPIMVPDSTAHYYILQKKINLKMLQQETKR